MLEEIKKYFQLFLGIGISSIVYFVDWLPTEKIQRWVHILTVYLLLLGILSMHSNKKIRKELTLERTNNILYTVHKPEAKSGALVSVMKKIKLGGIKMFNHFKHMNKTNIVSLILMLVSFAAGLLIAFVPALVGYQDLLIYILGTFFGSSFVGALSLGKEAGENIKLAKTSQERIKAIMKEIVELQNRLSDLNYRYDDVIVAKKNVLDFGGNLTNAEADKYNTYTVQKKAIEEKITEKENEIEKIKKGEV